MRSLSYRSRFRLAWELTWPLTALDLAVVFLIHGLFEPANETPDSVWALIAFFGVSPWVIRRAFAQTYRGLRIAVTRPQGPSPLSYQESLKVMWLLAWRSMVLGLAALLLLSLLLRIFGITARDISVQSPLANALGLSLIDAVTSLAFTPLLTPSMLRKRYKGFLLELQPLVPPSVPKPRREKS